jgi:DNA-binding transcriptional MocR family regulator
VVYLTGFSKTLAANLRVGLLAGPPELVAALTERKMLVGLTTSELGERVVYRVLAEGHYRRHLDRLRGRLDAVREPTVRKLEALGLRAFATPGTGMFVWMDSQRNANQLAQTLLGEGFVLAPGSLFHPDQRPSTWLRFNIATSGNPKMLAALSRALDDQALEKSASGLI